MESEVNSRMEYEVNSAGYINMKRNGQTDINKILNDLQDYSPTDVGILLMYYINENFKKEDRMNAIHELIEIFDTNFLSHGLSAFNINILRSFAPAIKMKAQHYK